MSMPNNPQYGAAMSPTQSQNGRAITPITDGPEVCTAEEPQLSRAPSTHQEQPLPFDLMQPGLGWDVLSAGRPMTGAQVYGTSAYNTQGGAYMGQYPDIPTDTGPYAVQHAHTSSAMPYHSLRPQTAFEMDAGTDAGQASRPQMHYLPDGNSPTLQGQHHVFLPNQSAMTAPGFEPNNVDHFNGSSSSGPHPRQSLANASTSYQNPDEPNANQNGWTQDQEDLIRRCKDEGKKVKQIVAKLKNTFGVVRSGNAVSKRWKIIKQRSSRVESKKVIQNVMPSSFQLFNTELARIAPGYLFDASGGQNHQHDPQVSGITHEVQEYFQKGYTKLVEECVFMWQRGQAQQPQGQGQGRHGGANL